MFIERCGATKNGLQFRQIVVIDYRVLAKREHDRRHQMRQRHAVVLKQLEEGLEFKTRRRHDGGALIEAHVQDDDQTVNVEERQDADQRVVLSEVVETFHLAHVGHQIVVSEHDTFGKSGGATRIGQRYQILTRIDVNLRKLPVALQQRGEGLRTVCADSSLVKDKQLFNVGFARRGGSLLQKLRHGNQKPRARIFQLMRDLMFGV